MNMISCEKECLGLQFTLQSKNKACVILQAQLSSKLMFNGPSTNLKPTRSPNLRMHMTCFLNAAQLKGCN